VTQDDSDLASIDRRDEAFLERFTAQLDPVLSLWFDPTVRGLERIPPGAALYVGNHNGGLCSADTFIFGTRLYQERGLADLPYGLAHQIVLRWPGMKEVLEKIGAVPASRENAYKLFRAGRKVLVYPGGDLDSMRPFSQRNRVVFGPRRGYLKVALEAGVPIVPIVAAGAHVTSIVLTDGRELAERIGLHRLLRLDVCPLTFSIPWGFYLGITPPHLPLPTRILVEVLDPIHFDRQGSEAAADAAYVEACHEQVVGTMQEALTRLSAERGSRLSRALGWLRRA